MRMPVGRFVQISQRKGEKGINQYEICDLTSTELHQNYSGKHVLNSMHAQRVAFLGLLKSPQFIVLINTRAENTCKESDQKSCKGHIAKAHLWRVFTAKATNKKNAAL